MRRSSIAAWMIIAAATLGQAAAAKLSPELQNIRADEKVDVIVQYRESASMSTSGRLAAAGHKHKRDLGIVHGALYSVSGSELQTLAADPDVEFVSPDHPVFSTDDGGGGTGIVGTTGWGAYNPNAYKGKPDFGWRTAGADMASNVFGLNGSGIGIAVIDSGVQSHQDLNANPGHGGIVYSASFNGGAANSDSYGHGTHVAGIVAGNGFDSTGTQYTYTVRGVAPGANIISLQVLDQYGFGTDSAVIAAIQQAIQLKGRYNIRVINLSLGRSVFTSYVNDPLCQAVQQAWQAGIVVVVAAGNLGRSNLFGTNGYGTITAPGNSPYVITVGAMNTVGTLVGADDKIASYSSKGPTSIDHIVKPDLVAPGNRILSLRDCKSTLDNTYPNNQLAVAVYMQGNTSVASNYYVLSGTSMAAPMVSGAAALLLQQNPSLTPDEVKARLMKTATKFAPGFSTATDPLTGVTYTDEYDVFTIGAGYLNIPAALANNDLLIGPALSPTATFDSASGTVLLGPTGTAAVWGSAAIWGSAAVWGNAAVWGSNVFVNGTAAVWGSGAVWGTAAVWGSSTPWAFAAVWGNAAVWGLGLTTGEATTIAINGDN